MPAHSTQESFLHCYRGHHSPIRHAAYMRMSKVKLIQLMLLRNRVTLEGRAVMDYGFGSGTFFRHCPVSARIYGLELDPVNVREVSEMLADRRFGSVNLAALDLSATELHPLLQQQYDVIICSHVLEHLPDPEEFLRTVRECLKPDGVFVGLIPINERKRDPHHLRELDLGSLSELAKACLLRVVDWVETDHWLYWIQPLFTHDSGFRHKLAQALSLLIGFISLVPGSRLWFWASSCFGLLTRSRPTQAGFLLARESVEAIWTD